MTTEPSAMRFYFDYISPYAYLAWTQMPAIAAQCDRPLDPVPILFAGCLNAFGHKGPAEIPPKRIYVIKNASRIAHRLRVPISAPPSHPFNPLLALRVTSLPMPAGKRRDLIDRLFAAIWVDGSDITDPDLVARMVDDVAIGLSGSAAIEKAQSTDAKALVRARTDDAVARGVFGVPTVEIDGELFWGVDSLDHIAPFVRGEDPIDAATLARWRAIQPSASRKPR